MTLRRTSQGPSGLLRSPQSDRSRNDARNDGRLDERNDVGKPQCWPNTPARKIPRAIHEGARDMARDIAATEDYVTSRRQRKKVEMLFAISNAS
jgi:hypothetical protein